MPYLGKTPSQATRQRYYKTASGGETSISGTMTTGGTLTFNDGEFVDVSVNGVALVAGTDYNTNTANTIAGLSALSANDQVEIIVYDTFSVFSGDVDSNLSVGGNLSVTGTSTLTGNVSLPDNAKAIFGAGSDLELSHNGTNSIIEGKTGDLILRTAGTESIFLQDAGGNNLAQFNDNSDVKLYHNANEKLATTSAGVTVTGDILVSDAAPNLELKDTDTNRFVDISYGTRVATFRNTMASSEDIDTVEPSFVFSFKDDGETRTAMTIADDGTTSFVTGDNATTIIYKVGTNVAGIRSASGDDFCVGTDSYNQAIRIKNDTGRVGIGINAPEHVLDVAGDDSGPYLMRIFNDGNNSNRKGLKVQVGADSGDQIFIALEDGDGSGVGSITGSGGTVTYGTFTAIHPATLPSSDTAAGYPYGTLVETIGIAYSQNSAGEDTQRGIIYNVQKSSSANSKAVLGAYSSVDHVNDGQHNIAVLGDGHILCNNSGGDIAVGDGICTSATAGIGQKATASPSMIIGIAQEAVTFANDSETKLVPVQYGLQQFTPWS